MPLTVVPEDTLWLIIDLVGRTPAVWSRLAGVCRALHDRIARRARVLVALTGCDRPGAEVTDLVLRLHGPLGLHAAAAVGTWLLPHPLAAARPWSDVRRLTLALSGEALRRSGARSASALLMREPFARGLVALRLRVRAAGGPVDAGSGPGLPPLTWPLLAVAVAELRSLRELDLDLAGTGLTDRVLREAMQPLWAALPPGLRRVRLDLSGNRLTHGGLRPVCRALAACATRTTSARSAGDEEGPARGVEDLALLVGGNTAGVTFALHGLPWRPAPARLCLGLAALRGAGGGAVAAARMGALCAVLLAPEAVPREALRVDLSGSPCAAATRFLTDLVEAFGSRPALRPLPREVRLDLGFLVPPGWPGDGGRLAHALELLGATLSRPDRPGRPAVLELGLGGLEWLDLTDALDALFGALRQSGPGAGVAPRRLALDLGPTRRGSRYCWSLCRAMEQGAGPDADNGGGGGVAAGMRVGLRASRLGREAMVNLALMCTFAAAPRDIELDLTGNPDLLRPLPADRVPGGGGLALFLLVVVNRSEDARAGDGAGARRALRLVVSEGDATAVAYTLTCIACSGPWPEAAPVVTLDLRGCTLAVGTRVAAPPAARMAWAGGTGPRADVELLWDAAAVAAMVFRTPETPAGRPPAKRPRRH